MLSPKELRALTASWVVRCLTLVASRAISVAWLSHKTMMSLSFVPVSSRKLAAFSTAPGASLSLEHCRVDSQEKGFLFEYYIVLLVWVGSQTTVLIMKGC